MLAVIGVIERADGAHVINRFAVGADSALIRFAPHHGFHVTEPARRVEPGRCGACARQIDPRQSGVIGRQGEPGAFARRQIYLEVFAERVQITHAAADTGIRVEGIVDAHRASGVGGELHEAQRATRRLRARIELTLEIHLRHDQTPVEVIGVGVAAHQVVIGGQVREAIDIREARLIEVALRKYLVGIRAELVTHEAIDRAQQARILRAHGPGIVIRDGQRHAGFEQRVQGAQIGDQVGIDDGGVHRPVFELLGQIGGRCAGVDDDHLDGNTARHQFG